MIPAVATLLFSTIKLSAQTPEEVAELKTRVIQLEEQSKWPQATPLAEKLVRITSQYYGHNSSETADALHRWAWLIQNYGDYDKAEQLWLDALAIDEKLFGKDSVQTTRRLHFLGDLYRECGKHQRARSFLERALSIREEHYGPDHPGVGEVLMSLGNLYRWSNYAGSETNLSRALIIFEKGGPGELVNVASTLSAMGWLAIAMGDTDLAEQRMRRSLELRRNIHGEEHESIATAYSDLGVAHHDCGQIPQAISFFQQATAIRQRLYGTNHVLLGESLQSLGGAYLDSGDLAAAESALERARQLIEMHFGPEHRKSAYPLAYLSRIQERRGNYAAAKTLRERGYGIAKESLGTSHEYTIGTLRNVVRLRAILGEPGDALRAADVLQDAEEATLANLLSFTSERQRLLFQHGRNFPMRRYSLWADLGAAKPLARAILRTKGLVLDSLLEDRVVAESSDDPEVRELVNQLAEIRSVTPFWSESQREALDCSISSDIETLQAALARRVTGVGRARRALSIRLEDVQEAIPQGSVLLEMLRYRHCMGERWRQESYGALVISRNEEPRWVCLGAAEQIEKSVKIYQHAVRNAAPQALVQSLAELYRQVWAPLAPHLPAGTKKIIISPDGELNFLSFATLLQPNKSFLGEQYWFSYVSCGRDLTAESPASLGRELLVWANPDFGASISTSLTSGRTARSADIRGLDFRPLPWAEEEGRELCRRASELGVTNAVLHLAGRATEEQLLQVRSPKILHLATHGFLLPAMNTDSRSATPFSEFEVPDLRRSSSNPMMRSGLALAGAQRTLQLWAEGKPTSAHKDGIVTADDIALLDLRRTWLVVLSACDTGLGIARAGEGVLGLRRGFIQAGAQNLLLTLWPIDDEGTRRFMSDFYTQLQKSRSPAHALAEVQRNSLKTLRARKGIAEACRIAGPFILSFQGRPE
jgi:CHAT domain-containing protein/Tfp pilus assembly protein PilF